MGNAALKISGAKRLDKKLAQLPRTVERKLIVASARPAGYIVRDSARALAPKKSGAMANTLEVRVKKGKPPGIVVQTARRGRLGIPEDSPWYYPAIVEYGSPSRNIPASRFMHRGLEAARGQAMAVFIRNLWAGVKAEATKK